MYSLYKIQENDNLLDHVNNVNVRTDQLSYL